MRFWKERSWFPFLSVVFLLGLLVLLATLQFRWLGQISHAEGARLDHRVKEDTKRFAEDFDGEIQAAFFAFQMDDQIWSENRPELFSKRLTLWLEKAEYPNIIKGFYFVRTDQDQPRLLVYDPKNITFEKAADDEISKMIIRLVVPQKSSDQTSSRSIIEELPALVIPVHKTFGRSQLDSDSMIVHKIEVPLTNEKPQQFGFLIINLNEQILKDELLPALVKKYFTDGESSDYLLEIVKTNDPVNTVFQTNPSAKINESDASAKLFGLLPNSFKFLIRQDVSSLIDKGEKQNNVFIDQQPENTTRTVTTRTRTKADAEQVRIEMEKGTKPGTAIFKSGISDSDGLWTLKVQHADGSLQQFVENTRRRNLAVSFGILALLAVSVVLIFVSAFRSKLLAQRQIDFVSSVSHEFRTPLAVIYSASENLTDGIVSSHEQINKYGDLIKSEGKKLSRMVEQILEFAGARSGNRKYDFRQTDIRQVIEEALAECRSLIEEKEFILETDIDGDLPIISADGIALCHAVQNLIFNAIKYSNGNRWIKVSVHETGGRLNISVEDSGIGIPKKELDLIFEPFYRSKTVVDDQIHGNGLGLSLVKHVVEAHRGKVSVVSEVGRGSAFLIELPVK